MKKENLKIDKSIYLKAYGWKGYLSKQEISDEQEMMLLNGEISQLFQCRRIKLSLNKLRKIKEIIYQKE